MLIKMSTLSIVICFFCAPRYVLKYQSVLVLFVYSMKTYWLNFSRPCGQLLDYCTQTAIVHAIDQAIQFFDRLVEHVAVVCHIYVQRRAFFALLFQSCIFTFVIFSFTQVLLVMHKSALFKPSTSWVTASAGRGMYPAAAAALWQFYREPDTIRLVDIDILYFATEFDLERKKYAMRVHEQSTCSANTPIQVDRSSSKDNGIDVENCSFEELKHMAAALRHEKPPSTIDFSAWETIYMWQKVRQADGTVHCRRINASRASHEKPEECPPM